MPTFRVTAPDGKTYDVTGPEGSTAEQALEQVRSRVEKPGSTSAKQHLGNLAAGAVRGAGSIGATLLAPIDIASDLIDGKGLSLESNRQRRQDMTDALGTMGAQTDSGLFSAGKLGGELAGTLGAGGALANVAGRTALSKAPQLLEAIRTAGMTGGNVATRAAGGAVSGGLSAGMVDPEQAVSGAGIGAATPGAIQLAGKAGHLIGSGVSKASDSVSNRLMQSAIKPTIKQLQTGDADTAVQTLLKFGINPNKAGVDKLRAMIGEKNSEIAARIAGSTATIDKGKVVGALGDVRQKFSAQVSPSGDLNAIQGVADDFMNHPGLLGSSIPVQDAQKLKQGTYKVLAGKYGEAGSASTEAQKALARGLKEEIAAAVPEVGALNAAESQLITTLKVAERRALMELNKNPIGLAALASNPVGWAAFMADKSALFKSIAARMVRSTQQGATGAAQSLLGNQTLQQAAHQAAPVLGTSR
jgi:hypothetical protein